MQNQQISERKKIVFFSRGDDSFIGDVIEGLSTNYETKKITIKNDQELKLIDEWMAWADICWFEWCDGLIGYGSKLEIAREKKLICRLHSYEAFTGYPFQVNWNNVDRLIFVAEHIRKYVIEKLKIDKEKAITIPNAVNVEKWTFIQRNPGFKAAYVGYINYKKGPMLLLQTFKALYDRDPRYELHIAGGFQDPRYSLYFDQMIKELGLENNYFFDGWQEDLDQWLEDKNYILCSSVLESQNMSVMQAMAKGIKPVIHNFVGAKGIYRDEYLWNTTNEAVEMIIQDSYHSGEYRRFIEDNYSLAKQHKSINTLVEEVSIKNKKIKGFDYKEYWNQRLNSQFSIEGVGYAGLGEIYNRFLYRNRMEILEGVLNKTFDSIDDKKVLELGPGTGMFTEYFYRSGVREYNAIDIVDRCVSELSRKYNDYHFRQGDVSDSDNYEGKYDLIFAAAVLLHITSEENYKKTIQNISDHLEDNGICILLEPVSVIRAASKAQHVIIRDREYVAGILEDNHLELIKMLPAANFMNYPFDKDVIGDRGNYALEAFNLINRVFAGNAISNDVKQSIGEYLSYKEKQLLYHNKFGLSEKLLIIRKKDGKQISGFNLNEILDIDDIKANIRRIKEELNCGQEATRALLHEIDGLLVHLEDGRCLSMEYIRERLNGFIPYSHHDFDHYDFSDARLMMGKRERFSSRYDMVEFIINNAQNTKLIVNNIWYDAYNKVFIFPEQMQRSVNLKMIQDFVKKIMTYEPKFKNNVAGFIFDSNIVEDIKKNAISYLWERGIPASEYMPLMGYLRIAERYAFAADFINKDHKVLEAPCGFGYGAAYFSGICKHVEALDIAKDNIVFAKAAYPHPNINWITGDVLELPYNDEEFDIYVSFEVFESLTVELAIKHIAEGYRVIKKSGKFILSTPNRAARKHINNPFHIKEYEFSEFREILKKYFETVEFYSVEHFSVEHGMKETAIDMIAVCQK